MPRAHRKVTVKQRAMEPSEGRQSGFREQTFLPDFCNVRTLLAVIIVAELLAFVLALASDWQHAWTWDLLGLISLFVQWVALSSAALLCALRRPLSRLNNIRAGIMSYLLVLVITLVISDAAHWILVYSGKTLPPGWRVDFVLRNLLISAIVSALILRFFYLQHQQRQQAEARAQARLEALQARIRPHFLFNAMNTIAALIRSQPERAEEAVEDLSDLFRFSLADPGRLVTLEEELDIARRYLQMEQLRLRERLRVEWTLESLPLQARLPALMLQPLLENAIYHGVEPLPEGGTIRISGSSSDGRVILTLVNPVPAADQGRPHSGHRMALENIRERLAFAFGQQAELRLDKAEGECTVTLRIPVREVGA